MQISLPPDLEKIVRRKVESRLYKTPDDVIRMAIEVLVEHDREDEKKLKVLHSLLQEADDASDRGEVVEFSSVEELLKGEN